MMLDIPQWSNRQQRAAHRQRFQQMMNGGTLAQRMKVMRLLSHCWVGGVAVAVFLL
jgi:hypothetical protein